MVGNRVYLKKPVAKPEWIEQFKLIPATNIADVMARTQALHPRIRLMSQPRKPIVAGSALTVKTRAGDNLFIHVALMHATAGDVLVIDTEANHSRALMGEIMFNMALYKQLSAIIIDGAIRDYSVVCSMELPIYATGTTPAGPYKEGPGAVNVPISCGGVVVNPGDIIVADADGAVVIPLASAPQILEDAKAFSIKDQERAFVAKSSPVTTDWITEILSQKETTMIDDMYYPQAEQG